MSPLLDGHDCNAYCGRHAEEHCQLLRTNLSTRDEIWAAHAQYYRVWVTDAVPAREPERWDRVEMLAGTNPDSATEPWLVWWREDYARARADYSAGRLPRFRSEL